MVKAYVSRLGREIADMGCSLVKDDIDLMRGMSDMETVYTYEGSYDINVLVCGAELTGISAFKL